MGRRISKRTACWTLILAMLAGLGGWQLIGHSFFNRNGAGPNAAQGEEDGKQTEKSKQGKTKQGKSKKKHVNRLAKETSPYLLLHAHNPVDWYPWGAEALAKAKKEDKLIFISIGYSSCYWCHVMERESFTDEEIAQYLNQHYVCIKIDREERPDIDEIYMTALRIYNQMVGNPGRGGWPLSMFLTPDAKPLGGFTYMPPRADKKRGTDSGFIDVLKRVQNLWKDNPKGVQSNSDKITAAVKNALRSRALLTDTLPDAKHIADLQTELADDFDARYGGFGFNPRNDRQPKFPEPSNLEFLLDRMRRADDEQTRKQAEKMLVKTLDSMAEGGIWDHLGGGFHRYSTDRYWRIPHFEKMLYDNGQLASVYVEAFELTGREAYRDVVERLLLFVQSELTGKHGAFYSALDAETDAEEGLYYVWETDELKKHLDEDEYRLFADAYGVSDGPNFEHRHTLLLPRPLAETAKNHGLSEGALKTKLRAARAKLMKVRNKRDRPLTDTKVLAAWNGLMIRGFADAGRVFKHKRYIQAAANAADFVLKELLTDKGRLLRTYAGGEAKLNGYLDDYAFFVNGLIALHRASGEKRWLITAGKITDKQIELFWDERDGGFFFTSSDHEALIARSKGPNDGARPSGNSVAAENLVYLGKTLKQPKYLEFAEKTIAARSGVRLAQRADGGTKFAQSRRTPGAGRPGCVEDVARGGTGIAHRGGVGSWHWPHRRRDAQHDLEPKREP